MESNMASNSGNERAASQSPKKQMDITYIPDSDVEDTDVLPANAKTAKLKGIIEQINADSDDEDDDDDDDRPVDFGEEEEEEEEQEEDSSPPAKPGTPTAPAEPKQNKLQVNKMVIDHESNESPSKQTAKKSSPSSKQSSPSKGTSPSKATASSAPKSRSKKASNTAPTRSIKKTTNAAKGKAKATKRTLATKKSASLLKSAAQSSSSPKAQKTSSTTTSLKAEGKEDGKPSSKEGKKSEREQKEKTNKSVKPKKSIEKTANQGNKKTLLKVKDKQNTASATYSKKTKANSKASTPQSGKGQKAKSPKAKALAKKTASKKKGKKPTEEDEDEVEENSGTVEYTSEGEATDASAEMDDDETMSTPKSKIPIIGSLSCSSRDPNTQALLNHAVQQLGKYRAVNYGPDSDVNLHAYIISAGTKRGWGVLQALASGAQLVSEDWLSSSISEGSWRPMSAFTCDRFGKSPRSVTGVDGRSGILHGMRIKVQCEGQDEASVRKLASLCGARVAETRVEVCINDTGKKIEDCVNVTKKWLADSVESGLALEYQPYAVGSG